MTQAKTNTNSRGGQTGYLLFLLVSILFAIFFIMVALSMRVLLPVPR